MKGGLFIYAHTIQCREMNKSGENNIIAASAQTLLLLSFTGYQSREIILEGRTQIDIKLLRTEDALSAVVVTALGIMRLAKSLTHSTQK